MFRVYCGNGMVSTVRKACTCLLRCVVDGALLRRGTLVVLWRRVWFLTWELKELGRLVVNPLIRRVVVDPLVSRCSLKFIGTWWSRVVNVCQPHECLTQVGTKYRCIRTLDTRKTCPLDGVLLVPCLLRKMRLACSRGCRLG